MTRGNFVVIFEDKILRSMQFNGDMYPEGSGHGKRVCELLGLADDEESFTYERRKHCARKPNNNCK